MYTVENLINALNCYPKDWEVQVLGYGTVAVEIDKVKQGTKFFNDGDIVIIQTSTELGT